MSQGIQCRDCKNYMWRTTCLAYPDGIPDELFSGLIRHDKPFEGDNGIVFEEFIVAEQD